MGRVIFMVLTVICMVACQTGRKETKDPAVDTRLDDLRTLFAVNQHEAAQRAHPDHMWLVWEDCDSMLWTGKYATAVCDTVAEPDMLAAEIEEGRFGRRPDPRCWANGEGNGSKTTWSRDMGMGLIAYAWSCKDLDLLQEHRKYGIKNNWIMGEPLADGRVIYTPQVISLIHEAIFALGGPDSANRQLPSVYPKGLTGYQAHLQVLNIWLWAEMEGTVSTAMLDRITEHADREPQNPFYVYMAGRFSGDQGPTMDLLLDPEMPMSSYVRCGGGECKLAEWLFVADKLLKDHDDRVKSIRKPRTAYAEGP